MDSPHTKLIKGAYKNAVAALAGTTIGTSIMTHLNAGIDPTQFNVATWVGIKHNLMLGTFVILIAEARYAKQWFDKWADSDGTTQP